MTAPPPTIRHSERSEESRPIERSRPFAALRVTKGRRRRTLILAHLVLIGIALIMMLPFLWMLLTSVKPLAEAEQLNPIPSRVQLENYPALFHIDYVTFGRYFFNSFFVAAWVTHWCTLWLVAWIGVLLLLIYRTASRTAKRKPPTTDPCSRRGTTGAPAVSTTTWRIRFSIPSAPGMTSGDWCAPRAQPCMLSAQMSGYAGDVRGKISL